VSGPAALEAAPAHLARGERADRAGFALASFAPRLAPAGSTRCGSRRRAAGHAGRPSKSHEPFQLASSLPHAFVAPAPPPSHSERAPAAAWRRSGQTPGHPAPPSSTGERSSSRWAGVAACSSPVALRSYRLTSRVCGQRPVTRPDVIELLEDCKQALRVHIPINVVQSREVVTRPARLPAAGAPSSRAPVQTFDRDPPPLFLHELGHVRRRDILVNWLSTFVHVLHWFNPWGVAMARMRADPSWPPIRSCFVTRRGPQPRLREPPSSLLEFAGPESPARDLGVLEDKSELKRESP